MKHKNSRRLIAGICVFLALVFAGCSPQAKRDRHFKRANNYFDAKKFDEAAIEYLNVLRLDRTNGVAIRRLGGIFYDQGEIRKAFAFLLKAKELEPNDLDVRAKLALVYVASRQMAPARQEATFILSKSPKHDEALLILADTATTAKEIEDVYRALLKLQDEAKDRASYHLAVGSILLRKREYKAAEAALRRAQALDPKSNKPYEVLGNLYWVQNNLEQADQAFKTGAQLAPLKSIRRLKWAEFKIKTGALDQAKKILEEILKQTPDYFPARIYLAQIAFGEQKYEECLASIKTVLAQEPANYEALLLRGRLDLARGQTRTAIEELDRLSKQYPGVPEAYYQLALAHLRNSDIPAASSRLTQALGLNPDYADAVLLQAEIQVRTGEFESAIKSLVELIRKRPDAGRAYLLLADAYRVRGTLDDALAVYWRMMESFPKNSQAKFLSGLVLRQQNKLPQARKAFEETLEMAPTYLPAVNQLLDLDLIARDYAGALRRVREQVDKNPRSPGPAFLMAKAYLAQTNYAQAEASLLHTIELDPAFRPAYMTLAQVYLESKKLDQALEKLGAVLAKNPNDIVALTQVASIHEKRADMNKAREHYERVLKINPRFGPALNNLAYIYVEHLGQLDKALELARKAREVMPNDPAAADTMGWILFRRGDYTWAQSLLQESADKLPAEPEVLFHLGMVYYMMGEEGPARAVFQRALDTRTEFAGKKQTQNCLAVLDLSAAKADAKAVAQLEKIISEQPNDVVACMRLADIHERDGAFDKARKAYERALRANPKAVSVTIRLAQLCATRLNDYNKALELAKEARKLAPNDPAIAQTLGRLAFLSGDYAWSLSLLQESSKAPSGASETQYYLAWASYYVGREAEAGAAMARALQLGLPVKEADDAKRFQAMVRLAGDPRQLPQAESQVSQVLKEKPEYVPALMLAAVLHEQRGKYENARDTYQWILGRYPAFAPAARQLAALYLERLGDYQKAFDLAVRARNALPQDADVARTLGKVVYRRGDYSYASRLLQESVRKRAEDSDAWFHLGMAHYQLKEKEQSRTALTRALALNDKAPFVAEARRVLGELK